MILIFLARVANPQWLSASLGGSSTTELAADDALIAVRHPSTRLRCSYVESRESTYEDAVVFHLAQRPRQSIAWLYHTEGAKRTDPKPLSLTSTSTINETTWPSQQLQRPSHPLASAMLSSPFQSMPSMQKQPSFLQVFSNSVKATAQCCPLPKPETQIVGRRCLRI